MEEFAIQVTAEEAGGRVDALLAERLDMSRNAVQRLIGEGRVTADGKAVKANYKPHEGEQIVVQVPEPEPLDIVAEDIPIDIIYEDEAVIVINKTSGMVVHPAPGHYSGTLVNALMYHLGNRLSGINGVLRPGIVHRIDRDTSGVLVVAKSDEAHIKLSEQLAEHSMTREYRAIVFGGFKEDEGRVDAPLSRHPQDRKKMAIVQGGRHAVTNYRVLERLGRFTYIAANLETGRTHQIRVHMASIHHPLLGDTVYGSERQPYNTDGQALHAYRLGFVHPISGEYMEFTAELPPDFQRLLRILRMKAM